MLQNNAAIAAFTKRVYIKQHEAYQQDETIFDRFYNVAKKPATYAVPDNFFVGKRVLDAGCGNTLYFQKAMYTLGASHVTCLDIGDEWIMPFKTAMAARKIPENFYECVAGSTTELPFQDKSFDFVASNGVLMHLSDVPQAEIALAELARVTKSGGTLYAYIGINKPGIMDTFIIPALRYAYGDNSEMREFVDTLTPEKLTKSLEALAAVALANDKRLDQKTVSALINQFTLDTCTFIQNVLQVPVQQSAVLSLDWATEQFEHNGMTNIRRAPEQYWQRNDFRKFLAPLHYAKENAISRILYGDGHCKVVGEKL